MSELRRLKEKLETCYLNGFFLEPTTFLMADDAEVRMVPRKGDDGRPSEQPMVILKRVAEMTVDLNGRIVAVDRKEKLGLWVDAFEKALERFNKQV